MVLSITPASPVTAARSVGTSGVGAPASTGPVGGAASTGGAAQATSVISATVQQVLSDNLVQVAIGNLLLELGSDTPLIAGQTVQLAVAHTDQGIRLAIIGQGAGAAAAGQSSSATVLDLANPLAPNLAPPNNDPLSPLERLAVSMATEDAATQQGSQAQLFADLNAVAGAPGLPPALRAAIAQVLSQQTPLASTLTGEDIKTAFQNSGLLLEASLVTGTAASNGNGPDLKAALIVLRQTLTSVLQTTDAATTASAAPMATSSYAVSAGQAGKTAAPSAQTPAPGLVPDVDMHAGPQPAPQGRPQYADGAILNNTTASALADALAPTKPQSLTTGTVLALLQEAQQQIPRAAGYAPLPRVLMQDGRGEDVVVRTNTPPPPFRGGQPTAQPIASPSLAPNASLSAVAHRLLDDTDAALSRQTLLQVASLPDRADTSGGHVDPSLPRWHFELPFATPQGTAMAQFEISRDANGSPTDPAKRVWRARFSLDVEPAGPVHALVALIGERTSVRMWAERPATAARLRAGLVDLGQALNRAELSPGDLVVQDGAPPAVTPPKAGHFLDRAL